MNLLEAIQNCGDNWFRPVEWSGLGNAIKISGGVCYVLNREGQQSYMTPFINLITGEWEIVTPEQVMKERK